MSAPSDPENTSEPGDEPVIQPVDPRDPEPDVNDGEAPQPTTPDEAHEPLGQFGPPAEYDEG